MPKVNWQKLGVEQGYRSATGTWHEAKATTLQAIARLMVPTGSKRRSATDYEDVWVLTEGESRPLTEPSTLHLEDGSEREARGYLARDLPLGYHYLETKSGARTRVIVTPKACYLPDDLRTWGWAVQLYAMRSKKSWGMGDLADLRDLSRWSTKELSAGMVLVNPLHAPFPTLPQQASPYYPSSRIFRNPLYLRIEEIPGANTKELAKLTAQGTALSDSRRIDRDAIFTLKMKALTALFAKFGKAAEVLRFEAYVAKESPFLEMFATFSVLAEKYGNNWRAWPRGYRHPQLPEVKRFRAAHRKRVRFHEWLQWLIDEQLKKAGQEISLVGDLAVGVDPSGADGWIWQELFADGMEVGAPPDEFNTQGQKWGLLPFDPGKLRANGYEPIVRIVRSSMRHMGGVRLDHVMGFFRLFWIPRGKKPNEGVYVRYPALDLMGIIALESVRAQTYVVGEDLGTVEDEVRQELSFRKMMSYRLLWFEPGKPETYPEQALASITTHDLPTVAGLISGADLAAQRALDLAPNEQSTRALVSKVRKLTGTSNQTPIDRVVEKAHLALSKAPSRILTATLDDALSAPDRPNMPGTTTEYPCWCIPLPKKLEEMKRDVRLKNIAKALTRKPRKSERATSPAKRRGTAAKDRPAKPRRKKSRP